MFFLSAFILFSPLSFDVLPVPLETPPFEYTYNSSPPATGENLPVLELISETRNDVTNVEEWFDRVVTKWPAVQFHNGGINSAVVGDIPPAGIRARISTPGGEISSLDKVINCDEGVIAIYGNPPNSSGVVRNSQLLLLLEKGTFNTLNALDFLGYARYRDDTLDPAEEQFTFQRIRWAEVHDGVVYVCNMHWTYAESSAGRNAYITALDLETNQLLWRTEPLICNSQNFIISGDAIYCGYGFTNEDDFVYVLNRLTGEVVQSIAVPSAPEYFWLSGVELYVRCYNTDCVFAVTE